MSFGYVTFQGEAAEYKPEVQFSAGHEREANVLAKIEKALAEVVSCVGGHVSVSAVGHINEFDDQPGDNLNLQVTSFLRPSDPVADAGASAALSSARNFPPEASTAAVPASDGSDPAPHQPIPVPVESGTTQSAQPEGTTVMRDGIGVTPGSQPNITPESPAPVEATISVDVPTDDHGDGEQIVEGPPASIKDVTPTGFGPLGSLEEETVPDHPDETDIVVEGGTPGGEEIEISQTEPEAVPGERGEVVATPDTPAPATFGEQPSPTSDQSVDEAPQSGAASQTQDEPPAAPADGQQA